MKKDLFTGLACLFLLLACSAEEVTPEDQNDDTFKEVQVVTADVITTPCEFDFNTIQEGDTLNIACSHDLDGANVFIPANVVINYCEGGKLYNGSLLFEENGKIDGRILNYQLEVDGKATLLSSTFQFEKENWNITEGEVSDEVALENRNNIQKAIDDVRKLGGETFKIDELDAYFLIREVDHWVIFEKAIRIPSDFSIEMTVNTHLRVQPNSWASYYFFSIREVSNVKISGGNLHGDRDQHDYTPQTVGSHTYKSHEWGHLIAIESGVNITIEGVHLNNAAGDGIDIHSTKHAYDADYIGSNNITITNCIFDSNRRNNLSITDGHDIIIENNTFLNAGIDTQNSKGTPPRCAIDIEAVYKLDSNNEIIYQQRAKDIIIRNNVEKGSIAGAFLVAIGENVTIENNTTENAISFTEGTNIKITKNTIYNSEKKINAINARGYDNFRVYGNEISSNIIKNQNFAILLNTQDVKVFDNIIEDCTMGISCNFGIDDSEIYNNSINMGGGMIFCSGSINNLSVKNNNINVPGRAVSFLDINVENKDQDNIITVQENELNGGEVFVINANGVNVD